MIDPLIYHQELCSTYTMDQNTSRMVTSVVNYCGRLQHMLLTVVSSLFPSSQLRGRITFVHCFSVTCYMRSNGHVRAPRPGFGKNFSEKKFSRHFLFPKPESHTVIRTHPSNLTPTKFYF